MRKIFTLFMPLLILIMTSCSFNESSKLHSEESIKETSATETGEEIDGTEVILETVLPATTSIETIPKTENLNLGKTDEWSFNSRSKFIYFTDYGRYYPVEISDLKNKDYDDACGDTAKHNMVYNLCFDNGSKKMLLDNTKNCMTYYCDGNSVYIYKYDDKSNNNNGIYKLYKDNLTKIKSSPNDGYISAICFSNTKIYYSVFDEEKSAVYKMDYDGENIEHVFDNPTKIWDMTIHNEKIWFERSYEMYQLHGLAYYDMKTDTISEFKDNHIGYINNNYMYYSDVKSIYRINLSNFQYENIIKLDDYLIAFDLYKDGILYSSDEALYKMNDNENTLIFSTKSFLGNEGYYIKEIQCQNDRIFLRIGSGAFYQCIMEIDIDGNIVEVIHED